LLCKVQPFKSMNEFEAIDDNLKKFAKKHNAQVHTMELCFDSVSSDGRGLRKIIWAEKNLSKSILILPSTSPHNGFGSNLWDFTIHVSVDDDRPGELPFWTADLLVGVPLQEIERQIDYLLISSENTLATVKLEDMRLTWGHIEWPDGRIDMM